MSSVGKNTNFKNKQRRKKNMHLCVYLLLSSLSQHGLYSLLCSRTKQHCQTQVKLTVELRMNTVTHMGDICHVGCVVVTKMIQLNRVRL